MNKLYSGVFRWLAIGLAVSFLSGMFLALNENLFATIASSGVWFITIIVQIAVALVFGFLLRKLDYKMCIFLYLLYAVITGIDIAFLLLLYEATSVIGIFIVTSLIFAILAFISDKLEVNVMRLGTILFVSLIVVIIFQVINILVFKSDSFNIMLSIISLIIFIGYIIYDLRIVEPLSRVYGENKAAVYSAFQIYIDFINVFIRLLELFGKRRD